MIDDQYEKPPFASGSKSIKSKGKAKRSRNRYQKTEGPLETHLSQGSIRQAPVPLAPAGIVGNLGLKPNLGEDTLNFMKI